MNVLIAEDETTSRGILTAVLSKWGYEVVVTCDGNEAWQRLQQPDAPKIAVLDWMMPGMDGVEICRRIRAKESGQEDYTYLILLTAKGDKADIVKGMDAGADDYVVKPFDPNELNVRVRAGQRIIELQGQLRATQETLRIQSRTDALTGALNRRAILERLEAEMSRAKREKTTVSISMLDIDHFKRVNDTYGHLAGDMVLKECVARFRTGLRAYDSFGRFGGEEFLLIFPNTDPLSAVGVAERVRRDIGKRVIDTASDPLRVTVSQGVATSEGRETIDDLLSRADNALYGAKENGRDRVECPDAETTDLLPPSYGAQDEHPQQSRSC